MIPTSARTFGLGDKKGKRPKDMTFKEWNEWQESIIKDVNKDQDHDECVEMIMNLVLSYDHTPEDAKKFSKEIMELPSPIDPETNKQRNKYKYNEREAVWLLKEYAKHRSQGGSKKTFKLISDDRLKAYEKIYPNVFSRDALEIIDRAYCNYWHEIGRLGAIGEIKNFNHSTYRAIMFQIERWHPAKESAAIEDDAVDKIDVGNTMDAVKQKEAETLAILKSENPSIVENE